MTDENNKIRDYLNSLDKEFIFKTENEFLEVIKKLYTDLKLEGNDLYESHIFAYYPNDNMSHSSWDTYYGPLFTSSSKDGNVHEYPALDTVNIDLLTYCKKRALETDNPQMKLRYADVFIDFAEKLKAKKEYEIYKIVIDSTIILIKNSEINAIERIKILKRAINLAKSFNDEKSLMKLKLASIQLESTIAEDELPGLWGFTLNLFWIDGRKLLDSQELTLHLSTHVTRLDRLLANSKKNLHAINSQIQTLIKYYNIDNNPNKIEELIELLYTEYKKNEFSNDHPLKIIHYMEQIKGLCEEFSKYENIKSLKNRIQKEIIEYKPEWNEHLNEIAVEEKFSKKELDDYVNWFFVSKKDTKHEIQTVLIKIAVKFVQKVVQVKELLDDLRSKYLYMSLVSKQVVGHGNYVIATTEKMVENNIDFSFIELYSQNLAVQDFFLDKVLSVFIQEFSMNQIHEVIMQCDLFDESYSNYLNKVLENYYANNYLETSSLLIPLIEKLIRKLCENSGESVLTPDNEYGGYKYKTLNKLLDSPSIKMTFESIGGHDVSEYLKIVLVSKVSLNIRNDFCHGENLLLINQYTSNRLFHILLLLSLVRFREK